MNKEIEAKFLQIKVKEIRGKLEELGATLEFEERLMRRVAFDAGQNPDKEWARVRDEGDKITMAYKSVDDDTNIHGVKEVELIIDDFDTGRVFLNSIGLQEKAYQETKRLRYLLKDQNVEFDIDTWPGLETYIEIESDSELKVKKYAELLGFNWSEAMFGSADLVYAKKYNVTTDWINHQCKILKFDELPPELGEGNLRK